MRFVIVTGMSGAGKRTAMKMLEDAGYYCVDNMPLPLVEKFAELMVDKSGEIEKVALGLDARADSDFRASEQILLDLKSKGYEYELVFMDASDEAILKRYKESRRLHPLAMNGNTMDGIQREREIFKNIIKKADYVFDTSNLLTRVLQEELDKIFVQNKEYNNLMVRVVSFGFKYGILADADLVFDVRFLPNPYYIDDLKKKTGNEKPVQDYVMGFPEAGQFLEKLKDMLQFLIPNYISEGKHQLVIGIGCTGGKHRSVTLANELVYALKDQGNYGISITHRDIDRG